MHFRMLLNLRWAILDLYHWRKFHLKPCKKAGKYCTVSVRRTHIWNISWISQDWGKRCIGCCRLLLCRAVWWNISNLELSTLARQHRVSHVSPKTLSKYERLLIYCFMLWWNILTLELITLARQHRVSHVSPQILSKY